MAITFTFDLVNGNDGKFTDKGWQSLIRIVTCWGLDAPNGYDRISQALTALAVLEGIVIGTPHPAEPTATLAAITPEAMEPTTIKLKLDYRQRGQTVSNIRIGGSVKQIQNNTDDKGNDVILRYDYPADYPEQERQNETEFTGVEMNKLVPNTAIQIDRMEFFDLDGITPITHSILLNRSRQYQGKLNNVVWNVDPDGEAGQWMCTGIEADTQDGGFSYKVIYKFLFSNPDWKEKVVFYDPNTNKPVANQIIDYSYKNVQQYQGIDFNNLLL